MNRLTHNLMDKKGLTLVEVLVALPLILITLGAVLTTYITMQKVFPGGITQVVLQSNARSALGRIANNVRASVDAGVNAAGNTLSVTLDPNGTFNNPVDDVIAQYTLNGTSIIYDPNTAVNNNETVLIQNVTTAAGTPYFQKVQDLVIITFKATQSNAFFGTQNCSLSTAVKMRSNDG